MPRQLAADLIAASYLDMPDDAGRVLRALASTTTQPGEPELPGLDWLIEHGYLTRTAPFTLTAPKQAGTAQT